MDKTENETLHAVAVVVDPEYGDKLRPLAARLHVWILNTPDNKAVAQALWSESGGVSSSDRGATTFGAGADAGPDEIVESMLATIDLHHGEYSHSPPWSMLEVYGASPSPSLSAVLAELGFTKILPVPGGFKARHPNPRPEEAPGPP